VVPVQNHAEQMLNALDVVEAGFGITDSAFRLDRLGELPDRLDNARFRDWVGRGDELLDRVLRMAVSSPAASPVLWPATAGGG
jgi:hypothetical protein